MILLVVRDEAFFGTGWDYINPEARKSNVYSAYRPTHNVQRLAIGTRNWQTSGWADFSDHITNLAILKSESEEISSAKLIHYRQWLAHLLVLGEISRSIQNVNIVTTTT